MAFTAVPGDHQAMLGNVVPGALTGVFTVRWTGPFQAAVALPPQLPLSATRNTLIAASYAQAASLRASDPNWWQAP